jgi:osmotically-inducible protein OsmY
MLVTEQPGRGGADAAAGLVPAPRNVAERAEGRLRCNSYLALKNVTCEYRDGVLTLRGCLPTYYLKQVAQAAVDRLDGVERIVNEIEVTPAARLAPHPA